jgi:hypothetical protein
MEQDNVLKLIDIRMKFAKARYICRWSNCSYEILGERAGISKKVAKRWWRIFRNK